VSAPLEHLLQDSFGDVHDGNWLLAWGTEILDHVLDQHAALCDLALGLDLNVVAGDQLDNLFTLWDRHDDVCSGGSC